MDKPEQIDGVLFPSKNQPEEVLEPEEEAFDLPASFVETQDTFVMSHPFRPSSSSLGSDHLSAKLLHELLVQAVTDIGFLTDDSVGWLSRA